MKLKNFHRLYWGGVFFLIIWGILLGGESILLASPEGVTFKSSLVWGIEGDFSFEGGILSGCQINEKGEIETGDNAQIGTYESISYTTEGIVQNITVSWEFEGEVKLEVSTDGGNNYVSVINGVPLESDFVKGDKIRWKALLSTKSKLKKVKIDYQDSLGVITGFGNPSLSGFKFRRLIYIKSDAKEDLFHYQVKIKVGESKEAEDYDVECEGNIQNDFLDVRFTCADGRTLLSHYLEKVEGTSPKRVATFWVKIPQLPPQGLNIYIYYGNPQAESLSLPEEVFDFFDDFSTDSLDLEKWDLSLEEGGNWNLVESGLELNGAKIISKNYQIKNGIIEYQAKAISGAEIRAVIRGDSEESLLENFNQIAYSSNFEGVQHCIAIGDIVKVNQTKGIILNTTYAYRIILNGTNLTFQRYSKDFKNKEAEVAYNDEERLKKGHIGLKTGINCRAIFEWIRVRKYSSFVIEIDRELTKEKEAEAIDIAEFEKVKLAENGNLVLEGQEGSYASSLFPLPFKVRIFNSFWKTIPEDAKVMLDVSMDGGKSYAMDCIKENFYYASKNDFNSGNGLKFRLRFLNEDRKAEVEEVSIDYRLGSITIIWPNGGEILEAGKKVKINWSAIEYEEDYPLRLEYSLDGGNNYELISDEVYNTGSFWWVVPHKVTSSGLVRISDKFAPDEVFDTSDEEFSIASGGVHLEEKLEEEELHKEGVGFKEEKVKELSEEEKKEILKRISYLEQHKRKFRQKSYEVLIKIGDTYSSDPEESQRACFKDGDVVVVREEGHIWGRYERENFLIIKMYLKPQEVKKLVQPKESLTGEVDKEGKPKREILRRRKYRLDLYKIGLKGRKLSELSPEERKFLIEALEGKIFSSEILEEK